MSFVGIVSNNRDFNNIKKFFDKKNLLKPISLIEINEKNLKSIRNIT